MSPSEPEGMLVAAPELAGTEVTVFDAQLRKVSPVPESDDLRWSVPRGTYKVRYQAGSALKEQFVTVDDVTRQTTVSAPELTFTSAAPLYKTSTTHEYHTGPAVQVSHSAPVIMGRGANLFAFARSRGGTFARPNPLHGLTLRFHGQTVLDFADSAPNVNDTCAALHITLAPGPYRLRYETDACTLEQTIFLAQGWQTQIFISETPPDETVALDLAGMSVLMARPAEGFEPRRPDLKVAELARKALRRGRATLSRRQIEYLLNGKFENPMLGILAAHLLILGRRSRTDFLDVVIRNVHALVPGHPDVACLQLAVQGRSDAAVTAPPMLARSWELIVRPWVDTPISLAADSPLLDVATSLWDEGGAWLTWRAKDDPARHQSPRGFRGVAAPFDLLIGDGVLADRRPVFSAVRALLGGIADGRQVATPLGLSSLGDDLQATLPEYLSRVPSLTDSEVGLIVATVLEFARRGETAATPEALAPLWRIPQPLVRHVARDLASKLPGNNQGPFIAVPHVGALRG